MGDHRHPREQYRLGHACGLGHQYRRQHRGDEPSDQWGELRVKLKRNPEIQRAASRRGRLQSSLKSVVTLGLVSVSTLIAGPKLSKDLEALPPSASVNVILRFTRPPSAADMTKVSPAGGVLKTKFERINGAL